MTRFDEYRDSFPNAHLARSKSGVLEVALHTDGGTWSSTDTRTSSLSTCFMPSAQIAIIAW